MADKGLHLTRRLLVQAGIASGAVTAIAIRQNAIGQTVPSEAPTAPETDDAHLAARSTAFSQLTLKVTINDTGSYPFVIDTAAEQSVLSSELATRLNLPIGRTVIVRGLSHSLPAHTVTVSKLALGPFTHKNLTLPVLPGTLLGADGYLGLDIISNSRITFDFAKRTIRVERPRYARTMIQSPRATRVQATGSAGRLKITDCRIDGVLASAIIDTGAELSIGNIALKAALEARHGSRPDLGPVVLTGVTGGEIIGRVLPLNRIRMQNLTFTDCTVAIAEISLFKDWSVSNRPALLIGMDFLRQFNSVSIDYRAQEIIFDIALSPPNPRPGVQIEKA